MTTVLIDASNLHVGGGVQVASSFLDELADLTRSLDPVAIWPSEVRVEVSDAVMAQISSNTVSTLGPVLCDRHPMQLWRWIPAKRQFDVSFVVFGPEYGFPRAARRAVGFADGASVLPRPRSLKPLTGLTRVRTVFRDYLSRAIQSRASLLITESEVLAAALRASSPGMPEIEIVPNTINGIFSTPSRWTPVPRLTVRDNVFTVCYVARAYAHKNHKILPEVAIQLRQKFGLNVDFVVTLTDAEWAALSNQNSQINVGPLTVDQVPTLLASCDASIFPSLLESFSVTPFEAFAMARPLFASNCDFVRNSCKDAPIYFNPESPSNIAEVLSRALTNPEVMAEHVERGNRVLAKQMGPRQRAVRYMEILQKLANGGKR